MHGPTAPPSPMAIFGEALDLASPTDRAAYLDRACAGDPALRARVEALLAVHDRAGGFLESPAAAPTIDAVPPRPIEGVGTVIGPYRLMEPIGEGGMGVVYVAEQHHPVRRRVALKVIKPGMDSKQVIARFEAERQALALMDHPNIARVLDAGATEAGRPYFVMELVRGIPITDYCDRERLSISDRLELFMLVCRAVQHAHQKGVIHRDLKPSNILVTLHDGVPVPKVIDFGIAKAVGQSLTDKTVYTGFLQLVGTPLYMSPEQADLSGLDVDTRSDIYSLGVLLYELLTGTTPFDAATLRAASLDELRRIIRDEEPPKPSTRLSALGEALTPVSARRQADARRLDRAVRGELDWIVMKALEKDRTRRYETANDFAADVLRYLSDEPVEASPPSRWYRFRKLARRNRVALSTSTVVAAALVAGLAVSIWQAMRAEQARREVQAALVTANEARRETEAALATARRAVDEMYTEVAAKWLVTQGELTPLARQFLEKALSSYERFAARQGTDPKVQAAAAQAAHRVGTIRMRLGLYEPAIAAERQALATWGRLAAASPHHFGYRYSLAETHNALSMDLQKMGKMRESVGEGSRAIEVTERLLEQHPARTTMLRNLLAMLQINLGIGLKDSGRTREAEVVLRRSCEGFERLAEAEPDATHPRNNLGFALGVLSNVWAATGRFAEAEAGYKKVVGIFESLPGDHSELIAGNLANLAKLYLETGRDEALDTNRRALELWERLTQRNPHSPHARLRLLMCRSDEGDILSRLDRLREAEVSHRRAVSEAEALIADFPAVPGHREEAARALTLQAEVLRRLGRRRDAEEAARRAVSLAERLVAEFPELAMYRQAAADALRARALALVGGDRPGEVRGAFERALGEAETVAAADPDRNDYRRRTLAPTCAAVAEYYACGAAPEQRDPARAVAAARRAIEVAPERAASWAILGLAESRAANWDAAIEAAGKSLELCGGSGSAYAWTVLALAHARRGEMEKAHAWYARARPAIDGGGGLGDTPGWLVEEVRTLLSAGPPRREVESKPVLEAPHLPE